MGLFNWLFGNKSSTSGDAREPSAGVVGCLVGQRVLAAWLDTYFYPGCVRGIQGDSCEIGFDDGDVAWVHQANVRQPDIVAGSQVFCRFHAGPMYLPGKVQQQNGEKIHVLYENGEKEWTTLSMVRVKRQLAAARTLEEQGDHSLANPITQGTSNVLGGPSFGGPPTGTIAGMGSTMTQRPASHIPDVGDPVTDTDWRNGDRVLGRWFDFFWYPATILALGTKGYHLLFDDGDQRLVNDNGLMPLNIEEGEQIFIRPKNQPHLIYTSAKVLNVQGEDIDVELEDGTHETHQKVSRARFWRCPIGVRSMPFDEGERVLAQDVDGFTYPAEILAIDGDKIIMHFLDGPERMLTPELLRPFDLKVGTDVDCRWKGGQIYFPGKIAAVEGERVHIHYNDGDKEWTTIRLVRLAPGP